VCLGLEVSGMHDRVVSCGFLWFLVCVFCIDRTGASIAWRVAWMRHIAAFFLSRARHTPDVRRVTCTCCAPELVLQMLVPGNRQYAARLMVRTYIQPRPRILQPSRNHLATSPPTSSASSRSLSNLPAQASDHITSRTSVSQAQQTMTTQRREIQERSLTTTRPNLRTTPRDSRRYRPDDICERFLFQLLLCCCGYRHRR